MLLVTYENVEISFHFHCKHGKGWVGQGGREVTHAYTAWLTLPFAIGPEVSC